MKFIPLLLILVGVMILMLVIMGTTEVQQPACDQMGFQSELDGNKVQWTCTLIMNNRTGYPTAWSESCIKNGCSERTVARIAMQNRYADFNNLQSN